MRVGRWLNRVAVLGFLAGFVARAQTVQGRVVDANTSQGLAYATVTLFTMEDSLVSNVLSDERGFFSLSAPTEGKYRLVAQMLGYEPSITELYLYSGRTITVELGLKPRFHQLPEVTIQVGETKAEKPLSRLSRIRFYPEQTLRYAGTMGDVLRMTQVLPQVYALSDVRNDLVVRGNAPWGVMYRVEDIDIPNPNHFAEAGTSSGPVSILNNNTIAHLDFYAGAFPAEFVGAYSAVFDIDMKTGAYSQTQGIFQIGWTGTELLLEGPLNRQRKYAYLVSYRYSFLDLLKLLGVNFGTSAVPRYQDLTFTLSFPGKWETKIWGLGGISSITFEEDQEGQQGLSFAGINLRFASQMGASGVRTVIPVKKPFYLSAAVGVTHSGSQTLIRQWVSLQNGMVTTYKNIYRTQTVSTHIKCGVSRPKWHLRMGIIIDHIRSLATDTVFLVPGQQYTQTRNFDGTTQKLRAYSQGEFRMSRRAKTLLGISLLYHRLLNKVAIDPRASLQWDLSPSTQLRFGYSLLSTDLPLPIYQMVFTDSLTGEKSYPYQTLPFMKAHHAVLEAEHRLNKNWSINIALYRQWLFNIPVDGDSLLPWWSILTEGLNYGLVLPVGNPVPKGRGKNIGVELTLQKRFTKGTYALFTLSLFDSKYTGIDGQWYNTPYNGQFATNLLAGTEFKIPKSKHLTGIVDVRLFYAGGRWTHPIDTPATLQAHRLVWDYSRPFSVKVPNYFKLDLKLGVRLSQKKISQEWLLYLQNLTNHKNIFSYEYSPTQNQIITLYQMGFVPVMLYRLLF